MDIRKGQRWHCQNPVCGSEILVTTSSRAQGGSNPRCSCGEIMKKPYAQPGLRSLESEVEARVKLEASRN